METKAKEFNLTLSITFKDLEDWGYDGITDYCRYLVKEKYPLNTKVQVSRGDMVCLLVDNIGEAAKVIVNGEYFVEYREPRARRCKGSVGRGSTCV